VALTAGSPFPLKIEVANHVNGKILHIAVDYNNLPIRCHHCLSTAHLVKDCSAQGGKERRDVGAVGATEEAGIEKEIEGTRSGEKSQSQNIPPEGQPRREGDIQREGRDKAVEVTTSCAQQVKLKQTQDKNASPHQGV
jgi:hypothetical protein